MAASRVSGARAQSFSADAGNTRQCVTPAIMQAFRRLECACKGTGLFCWLWCAGLVQNKKGRCNELGGTSGNICGYILSYLVGGVHNELAHVLLWATLQRPSPCCQQSYDCRFTGGACYEQRAWCCWCNQFQS